MTIFASANETFRNLNSLIRKHVNVKNVARSLEGNARYCVYFAESLVCRFLILIATVDCRLVRDADHCADNFSAANYN